MKRIVLIYGIINFLIFISIIGLETKIVHAQGTSPDGAVYIVQPGDSLWEIAFKFRVSMEELAALNSITNPNSLVQGAALTIPGLSGIQGNLTTRPVVYGEDIDSISRLYSIPQSVLIKLNHLASSRDLYAGASLVIPEANAGNIPGGKVDLTAGTSILELAVMENVNPWTLMLSNEITATSDVIPGNSLFVASEDSFGPGALPKEIQAVDISPLPFQQGRTSVIRIQATPGLTLTASLLGHNLQFFEVAEGVYVSMQGIHAMTEPGLYPLSLAESRPDGRMFSFSQIVTVALVNYPYDKPLTVDEATIDPSVTKPEDAQWSALAAPITPERMWSTVFQMPSPLPVEYCLETNDCWSSRFGNRRSYNGSTYSSFHTGLDLFGGTGTEIYAPAPGIVVFSGPLTVRGNATMINHGWGVYTGYMHQSETYVKAGDKVEEGQLIGLVGATGRVEGAHLHWEIWVNGVQVDPLDWLRQAYP